jgi:glyoxylase-like metal-dependent hydrolase (beta-lactamase superfamily II)
LKVQRLKVAIPIKALGHVNSYVIADCDGFSLVDPGMYWANSFDGLAKELRGAGLSLRRLKSIIVTHFHVDHATAAPVLANLTGAEVYMGAADLEVVRRGFRDYFEGVLETYRHYGVPEAEVKAMREVHPVPRLGDVYDELADVARPLREGGSLEACGGTMKVIEVPGHTPGHIALVGDVVTIVGDVILDRITPHVILDTPRASRDPLGDYLRTLERVRSLNVGAAMPGHGEAIDAPARRADEIMEHHRARLDEVRSLLSVPAALYDVARQMSWRTSASSWDQMSPYERYFAIGEALAHLRHLEVTGEVEEVSREGQVLFKLA